MPMTAVGLPLPPQPAMPGPVPMSTMPAAMPAMPGMPAMSGFPRGPVAPPGMPGMRPMGPPPGMMATPPVSAPGSIGAPPGMSANAPPGLPPGVFVAAPGMGPPYAPAAMPQPPTRPLFGAMRPPSGGGPLAAASSPLAGTTSALGSNVSVDGSRRHVQGMPVFTGSASAPVFPPASSPTMGTPSPPPSASPLVGLVPQMQAAVKDGTVDEPLATRISSVLQECKSRLVGRRKEMKGLKEQRDFLARSLREAEVDFLRLGSDWRRLEQELEEARGMLTSEPSVLGSARGFSLDRSAGSVHRTRSMDPPWSQTLDSGRGRRAHHTEASPGSSQASESRGRQGLADRLLMSTPGSRRAGNRSTPSSASQPPNVGGRGVLGRWSPLGRKRDSASSSRMRSRPTGALAQDGLSDTNNPEVDTVNSAARHAAVGSQGVEDATSSFDASMGVVAIRAENEGAGAAWSAEISHRSLDRCSMNTEETNITSSGLESGRGRGSLRETEVSVIRCVPPASGDAGAGEGSSRHHGHKRANSITERNDEVRRHSNQSGTGMLALGDVEIERDCYALEAFINGKQEERRKSGSSVAGSSRAVRGTPPRAIVPREDEMLQLTSGLDEAPMATVGVDTNHDGCVDTIVTGVDRNHDGIPDILQQDGQSSLRDVEETRTSAEEFVSTQRCEEQTIAVPMALVRESIIETSVDEELLTAREALAQGGLAQGGLARDALARESLARDPLARDPLARDALARDALARDALDESQDHQLLAGLKAHVDQLWPLLEASGIETSLTDMLADAVTKRLEERGSMDSMSFKDLEKRLTERAAQASASSTQAVEAPSPARSVAVPVEVVGVTAPHPAATPHTMSQPAPPEDAQSNCTRSPSVTPAVADSYAGPAPGPHVAAYQLDGFLASMTMRPQSFRGPIPASVAAPIPCARPRSAVRQHSAPARPRLHVHQAAPAPQLLVPPGTAPGMPPPVSPVRLGPALTPPAPAPGAQVKVMLSPRRPMSPRGQPVTFHPGGSVSPPGMRMLSPGRGPMLSPGRGPMLSPGRGPVLMQHPRSPSPGPGASFRAPAGAPPQVLGSPMLAAARTASPAQFRAPPPAPGPPGMLNFGPPLGSPIFHLGPPLSPKGVVEAPGPQAPATFGSPTTPAASSMPVSQAAERRRSRSVQPDQPDPMQRSSQSVTAAPAAARQLEVSALSESVSLEVAQPPVLALPPPPVAAPTTSELVEASIDQILAEHVSREPLPRPLVKVGHGDYTYDGQPVEVSVSHRAGKKPKLKVTHPMVNGGKPTSLKKFVGMFHQPLALERSESAVSQQRLHMGEQPAILALADTVRALPVPAGRSARSSLAPRSSLASARALAAPVAVPVAAPLALPGPMSPSPAGPPQVMSPPDARQRSRSQSVSAPVAQLAIAAAGSRQASQSPAMAAAGSRRASQSPPPGQRASVVLQPRGSVVVNVGLRSRAVTEGGRALLGSRKASVSPGPPPMSPAQMVHHGRGPAHAVTRGASPRRASML